MKNLRLFIRKILEEAQEKELITEPDDTEGREESAEDEASVAANVAGVTTPLGTGPTYPRKTKDKRKSPAAVAGSAFGGAKPVKNKKK